MNRPTRRLLCLLLPVFFGTALAQDDELLPEDQEEEIRRYTVEMIIFTYNEDVSVGSEVFIPDPAPPEEIVLDDLVLEFSDTDVGVADDFEAVVEEEELFEIELDTRRQYELVMLKEDELTMGEILGHLERLDVYEPVVHFGWTELTLSEEEADIRPLSSFVTPPDELGLEGDFQLYLGRYLHLVVNLQLDAPTEKTDTTIYEFGDYTYSDEEGGRFDSYAVEVEQPVHYRIEENRIFKSGDVRYFDHPKFGVIAKITRWEEPEPGEEPLEEFLGDTELVGFDGE